ncbi:MAG: helix-hairpin-helix domain-containing protein [Candidatus Saelkia tenebricola]|nr:helix-hairpin-helix domain-containing protein [Candidatus Saelkia tenebricola]
MKLSFTKEEKYLVLFLSFCFLGFLLVKFTGVESLRYSFVSSRYKAMVVFPLDLNSASYAELIQVPGIGGVYAERIIQYRYEKDGFSDLKELINVKGIGDKKFKKLLPYFKI